MNRRLIVAAALASGAVVAGAVIADSDQPGRLDCEYHVSGSLLGDPTVGQVGKDNPMDAALARVRGSGEVRERSSPLADVKQFEWHNDGLKGIVAVTERNGKWFASFADICADER